jgi:hypothetical protein
MLNYKTQKGMATLEDSQHLAELCGIESNIRGGTPEPPTRLEAACL